MKFLKRTLIVVVVLITVYCIIGLVLPSNLVFERSTVINTTPDAAFNYVSDFNTFTQWSPWSEMDTNLQSTVTGGTGVGSKYTWTSDKMGSGSITIIGQDVPKKVDMALLFGNAADTNETYYTFVPEGNGTKVTWYTNVVSIPFYERPFWNFIASREMEDAFDNGLTKLKSLLESNPPAAGTGGAGAAIQQVNTPAMKVITIRKNGVKASEVSQTLAVIYGKLQAYLKTQGAEMDGTLMPFAIYHTWDTTTHTTDVEAGLSINKVVPNSGEMKYREVAAGRAAMATHMGPYAATEALHTRLYDYVQQNNLQMAGPPWEVYVTDPTQQPDSTKWRTDIYYHIP